MRDYPFGAKQQSGQFVFDPSVEDAPRDRDTFRLLHERTTAAENFSYAFSAEQLAGFIAWAANEIVGYSPDDRTRSYLYTILPILIHVQDLLKIAGKRSQFASSLENALFDEKERGKRKFTEVEVEEVWRLWRQMIQSVQRTDEERKQDKDLPTYLFRLMSRLRKQFQEHSYRSYEQSIYGLLDPEAQIVRYVGMAHDVRRRYRRHLENRDGTQMKREWIGGLLARNLAPQLVHLERGPKASYYAEEREFRWIRYHLQLGLPLTNIEASYPHLVQARKSTSIDLLTEPLDIWTPSPIWWPIFVAQAQDEMDRSMSARKAKQPKSGNR